MRSKVHYLRRGYYATENIIASLLQAFSFFPFCPEQVTFQNTLRMLGTVAMLLIMGSYEKFNRLKQVATRAQTCTIMTRG